MDALALLCTLHADGPATLKRLRRAGCTSLERLDAFEPEELELLKQLDGEAQPGVQKSILGLAKDSTKLHERQQTRMEQLRSGLNASYVEIQQFPD
ncbi:MAG: hypothetical protein ABGW95_01485, partial [Candidatus Poseidoniia archaeon]